VRLANFLGGRGVLEEAVSDDVARLAPKGLRQDVHLFGIPNLPEGLQDGFRPAGQFDLDGPGLRVLPPEPFG